MNATEYIGFRVTPADFEALKKRAEKAGLNVSEYCRTRVFEFNGQQIPALRLPSGETIAVGRLEKGRLVFIGPEYANEEIAKGA